MSASLRGPAAFLFLAAMTIASPLQAQERAVMLALNTELGIPAQAQQAVIHAVRDALGQYAMQPVDLPELSEELRQCRSGRCAGVARAAARAQVAVGVALWPAPGDPAAPGSLVVSLIDERDVGFPGTAEIVEGDLRAAAQAALRQAVARRQLGPGPWLLVDGAPLGAIVELDGEVVGELPWHGRVDPGEHQLEVRMTGRRAHRLTVSIADDPMTEQRVEVSLQAEARGGDALGHIVGASALAAGGLALLAIDIAGLAMEQCLQQLANGECAAGDRLNVPAFAAYGIAGILALGGAAAWFAIALGTGDDGDGLQAVVGPSWLGLRGRF